MNVALKIYILGVIVAIFAGVQIMKEGRHISAGDLMIVLFMSLCSWCTALALLVGSNIKRSEDNRNNLN